MQAAWADVESVLTVGDKQPRTLNVAGLIRDVLVPAAEWLINNPEVDELSNKVPHSIIRGVSSGLEEVNAVEQEAAPFSKKPHLIGPVPKATESTSAEVPASDIHSGKQLVSELVAALNAGEQPRTFIDSDEARHYAYLGLEGKEFEAETFESELKLRDAKLKLRAVESAPPGSTFRFMVEQAAAMHPDNSELQRLHAAMSPQSR